MIDTDYEDYEPAGRVSAPVNLGRMSEDELLEMRARIDVLLPVTRLSDINLERELTLQFRTAQSLQRTIVDDREVAANQKAQVMNSVAATLQAMVKMQAEYYTMERLKRIEAALVEQLNQWPDDQTQTFFTQYERVLEDA